MENNQDTPQDSNTYASQKSVSQSLLNISILQTYIGTLIFVHTSNQQDTYLGTAAIILIAISFFLQFIIFAILSFLLHVRQEFRVNHYVTAVGMNSTVTTLSGVVLVINIAITAVTSELQNNISNSTNY